VHTNYSDTTDEVLLVQVSEDNHLAFTTLYDRYASPLYGYAMKRVNDKEACEEMIQEIFVSLWERRKHLGHVTQLRAYLYSALRYRIANHIAHSMIRVKYAQHYEAFASRQDNSTEEKMNVIDFNETLERSIASLPENCQKIFKMSRLEHLTIPEIAERMQLNTRTVENYITQALKHLREVFNR
jgi:RNA polymerase sigma-70 factor (ECF subfamily)